MSLICTGLNDRRKQDGKPQIDGQLLDETGPEIIEDFFETCVRDLPERGRNFIEEKLITEAGYRNPFPRDDAIAQGDLTAEQLERLVSSRLLRVERQLGTDRIELIHDVLTKVVRTFRDRERARRQEADNRETLRRLAAERDESNRIASQRLRLLTTAGGALALALVLALISFVEWRKEQANFEAYRRAQERTQVLEDSNTRMQALQQADQQRASALGAASRQAYDDAVTKLTASLSVFTKYQYWSGVVRAEVERGKIYALMDRLDAARRDVEEALDTAKTKGVPEDHALALEAEASLELQSHNLPGAQVWFRRAEDAFRLAGDLLAVARILEWRAIQEGENRSFDDAIRDYGHALDRYRVAGDVIGVERIGRALPWGFVIDLRRGHSFALHGDRMYVGRDTPDGAKNDISFPSKIVSRLHLIISKEELRADDARSLNGTTINASPLPYAHTQSLSDGDIVALAGVEVLQFRTHLPETIAPPSAWAILIDGSAKKYSYLTEPIYSLSIVSGGLKIEAGETPGAVVKLRRKDENVEFFNVPGPWSAVFEQKSGDYEYPLRLGPSGKWIDINPGAPCELVKLSADKRQIVADGPLFQIVTLAPDPASP